MRINIRYHLDLRMAGISLDSLDIAAGQLQLIGNAGMSETVKYDSRQIIILN